MYTHYFNKIYIKDVLFIMQFVIDTNYLQLNIGRSLWNCLKKSQAPFFIFILTIKLMVFPCIILFH